MQTKPKPGKPNTQRGIASSTGMMVRRAQQAAKPSKKPKVVSGPKPRQPKPQNPGQSKNRPYQGYWATPGKIVTYKGQKSAQN